VDIPRVVVAAEVNAHSTIPSHGQGKGQRGDFLEELIEQHNSRSPTQKKPPAVECHSIIDLTLSKSAVELRWSIPEHRSDHEALMW